MTEKRNMLAKVTPEIFEQVLQSLYSGVTVAQYYELNRERPNFPALSSIYKYCIADSANRNLYTLAREACADALADQVIIEADSLTTDPARASNRMKGRQWLASKIKPKVYGDKLDIDMKGSIDIGAAILEGRKRASLEPLTIDNEPLPINPFD